jgi:hypothetical protein
MGLLLAMLAALGLLAACSPLSSLPPGRLAPVAATGATATGMLRLSAPQVPARPVEGLERIDLSTIVDNPNPGAIDDVTLELVVADRGGRVALVARQSRLSLQPGDSRAVYWSWRVPASLAPGQYTVGVRALDVDGRTLSGGESLGAVLQVVGRDGQ